MKPGHTGLKRIYYAFLNAFAGLKAAAVHEAAFRQELFVLIIAIPLAFWVGDTALERVILIGSVVLVIIVEILNSAVEAVVDRIGPERHELSGRAKDLGAAAVLISILLAFFAWGMIFFF